MHRISDHNLWFQSLISWCWKRAKWSTLIRLLYQFIIWMEKIDDVKLFDEIAALNSFFYKTRRSIFWRNASCVGASIFKTIGIYDYQRYCVFVNIFLQFQPECKRRKSFYYHWGSIVEWKKPTNDFFSSSYTFNSI